MPTDTILTKAKALHLLGEQDKEERWAEVQKKITPWRLGIQDQEPELELVPAQRAARLGKQQGALLVVASLIDKPTNLGGVFCRFDTNTV